MQSNHCCHKTPTILVNQIYKKFDFVIRNIARILFLTTSPLCKQQIACYRKKEGNNLCEYHSSQFQNMCSTKSFCQTLHKMIFAFHYLCVEVFRVQKYTLKCTILLLILSGDTSKMLGCCKTFLGGQRTYNMLQAHLDGNSASEKKHIHMYLVFPIYIFLIHHNNTFLNTLLSFFSFLD